MWLHNHRFISLTGKFVSATRGTRSPLNVPAASMLGHLSFQRQPVIIYAVRSKYSPRLLLRVRTSRAPLHGDWPILKLRSVLIVKQRNEFSLKQRNVTAVSHLRTVIRLTKTVRKSAYRVEIYIYLTVRSILQLVIELIKNY